MMEPTDSLQCDAVWFRAPRTTSCTFTSTARFESSPSPTTGEDPGTGKNRILPISSPFRKVLEMRHDSPAGVPFPSSAYVFGDEIGNG